MLLEERLTAGAQMEGRLALARRARTSFSESVDKYPGVFCSREGVGRASGVEFRAWRGENVDSSVTCTVK